MSLPIYNPPAPHGDPVRAGLLQAGYRAGNAPAAPRYWEVICTTPPGANDLAQAMFGQRFVLNRELTKFRFTAEDDAQWTCTFPVPGGTGQWTIYWGSIDGGLGTLSAVGWIAVAEGPTPPPLNEVAAYLFNDGISVFDALNANTLTFLPDDSGGFNATPATITIQPFWP